MGKGSAQQRVASDAWHIARCGEGQCTQSDDTNAAAKAACWRNDCTIGRSKLLQKKLETKLPPKHAGQVAIKRVVRKF